MEAAVAQAESEQPGWGVAPDSGPLCAWSAFCPVGMCARL